MSAVTPPELRKFVLLISCPDQKGLIHQATGCLYRHGANILENAEHVNHEENRFHMRTEFTCEPGTDRDAMFSEIRSLLPSEKAWIKIRDTKPKRLVLLATREPHCLGDLLLRHAGGEMQAEIAGVFSQYDDLRSLTEKFGIPYTHVPFGSDDPVDRKKQEDSLLTKIHELSPDLLVLAKYMRVLSQEFISHFENRILNIHHSFLPAFIGKKPYQQAYDRGVKIIGATAHLVNEDLDNGPIITQGVLPVNHSHSPRDMAMAGKDIERTVLARALKLMLEDRVLLDGQRTVIFE